jgi:hypothetical protein
MVKNLVFLIFFCSFFNLYSQVGVGTNTPKATIEITGQPSVSSTADGVIAPRITRAQLIAKTAYSSDQVGAIVYVSDLSGTVNASTTNVTQVGYYFFNGTSWNSMNSGLSNFTIGDIKTGIQTTDHNGWIKLNGRAKSTLTPTQQSQATALGIGTNIPDATNSFLVQNGATLGSISGSNSITIAQNNLPNVTLYGRIGVSDASVTVVSGGNIKSMKEANNNWTVDNPDRYTNTSNIIEVQLNGGVTQQSLDTTPKSLSVNTFIFLGN